MGMRGPQVVNASWALKVRSTPHASVFGFGRRGCPRVALAGATAYAFMLAALATLNLR